MSLVKAISQLRAKITGLTTNPILEKFEEEDCESIDTASETDSFVSTKRSVILKNIKDLNIDFEAKFKSLYEDYSELVTYLDLKGNFNIEHIPEAKTSTPDFKLNYQGHEIYLELKSLSFSNGNLNYKSAQEKSLNANIKIEKTLSKGNKMGFGTYSTNPLFKGDHSVSPYSVKYVIEEIIKKINNNLKPKQFSNGETILFVDLKQLIIPSKLKESAITFFKYNSSIVSGVLWNVAFGRKDNLILKTIDWEVEKNVEGQLEENGILTEHAFIKGMIMVGYENFTDRKMIGFYRHSERDLEATKFIAEACYFINNDVNFNAFEVLKERKGS